VKATIVSYKRWRYMTAQTNACLVP